MLADAGPVSRAIKVGLSAVETASCSLGLAGAEEKRVDVMVREAGMDERAVGVVVVREVGAAVREAN
jgi:hypothetical protein